MTDNQRKFLYFPAWNRAFKANWRSERGAILPLDTQANPELAAKVIDLGEAIAKREGRAVKADDLRHAAEMLALCKSVSSSQMSEAEIDKCLATFRLLADPNHLASVVAQDKRTPDRKRMEWQALNNPLGLRYSLAICNNKFGTRNIVGLSDNQLIQLLMTLKSRMRSRTRKGKPAPASDVVPAGRLVERPDKADAWAAKTFSSEPSKEFDPYGGGGVETTLGTRRGD